MTDHRLPPPSPSCKPLVAIIKNTQTIKQMIDYNLWESLTFTSNVEPKILCPICRVGELQFRKDLFRIIKTSETKKKESEEWFDPKSDFEARFTGFLVCSDNKCREHTTVMGNAYYDADEPEFDEDGNAYYEPIIRLLYPKYFNPPIEIFRIEDKCPKTVRKQLIASFEHFFSDTEASANRLRVSIEVLCDELKIKKKRLIRKKNSPAKFQELKLHGRIEELKKTKPEIAELLLSVKHIGNEASHNSSITKSDLLDGYSFLQKVLNKLYDNYDNELIKKSRVINKNRKPLSKKK